jgi:hypothetical protein
MINNIKRTTNLQTLRVTGYGNDSNDPQLKYRQQSANEPDWGSEGNILSYRVDTEGGNSGSPVIDDLSPAVHPSAGIVVGVHTGSGCGTTFGSNKRTSFYNEYFWNATGLGVNYTVDLVDETDSRLTGSNIGRWESYSFKEYPLQTNPFPFSAEMETVEVLRADQNTVSSPKQKYNNWLDVSEIVNHRLITIENPVLYIAKFNKIYPGIIIKIIL